MGSLGVTWADIGCPLGVVGGLRGGSWAAWWGHGGAYIAKYTYLRSKKQTLGPSQGVQGGTRDAPRMHRGCTKDAPSGKYGGSVKAKGGFFLKSRAEMVVFRCFLQKCTAPKREA